jgi:hypothetical protein
MKVKTSRTAPPAKRSPINLPVAEGVDSWPMCGGTVLMSVGWSWGKDEVEVEVVC